jgi:magnesium-transporting ATPase (P-type)
LAYRHLSQQEFEEFSRALDEARNDILKREQRLAAVYELIERELTVCGVTAVEDKLQEEVC